MRNEREFPSAGGAGAGQGVGARLPRKEDDRLMRGRGQFVADIRLAGMQDVAFVRSPLAHARIRGIHDSGALSRQRLHRGRSRRRQADPRRLGAAGLQGFRAAGARHDKVRQVGELVAMCVAPTRAEAEDIAAAVELDLEELPAVHDMLQGARAGFGAGARALGRQRLSRDLVDVDISTALDAPIKVTREISTARQCMAPMEGRGVVANLDHRLEQLTLYSAAQMPHITRSGLAECLGLEQGQIRIISPDVGGGFGYKGILLPEEVCLSLAGDAPRPSGALDRGSPRASHRQRQLPRAPLRHHRLCRSRRQAARHRLRSDGRFRRLFVLSVLGLPGGRAGRQHPAGPLRCRPIAAAPVRSRPTSARSCPIAAWRAPASALRSN